MWHDLVCAIRFVLEKLFRKNSLPYVLQLKGYDVWIGNNRGNRYTRNNIDNDKFWLHTFDELAKYDITKIVSTVL